MSEADWEAFDTAWCAAMRRVPPKLQEGSMGMSEPLSMLERANAVEPLMARIGQRLLLRPDARSQTFGRWWAGSMRIGANTVNELKQLAWASRDPLTLAMALWQSVGDKSAEGRALAQAARGANPDSAYVQRIAQLSDPLPPDVWLERLAQATRMGNLWRETVVAALEVQGGGRSAASELLPLALELQSLTEVPLWDMELFDAACRDEPARDEQRRRLCLQAAERLWLLSDDWYVLTNVLNVGMRLADPESPWTARAKQAKALRGPFDNEREPVFRRALERRLTCEPDAARDRDYESWLREGLYGHLRRTQTQAP